MKVVAIRKGARGFVSHYKLEDGKVVTPDEAAELVKSGELKEYLVGKSVRGNLSIRTRPDLDVDNNIRNLPEF